MNMDGLSEMTLEKFIGCGFVKEYADLYHLDQYKERITAMEGGTVWAENLPDGGCRFTVLLKEKAIT